MKKAALLSVSDRTNLLGFARTLIECGYTLLTTSGTGKYLSENGIECLAIEQYTGQKEILDGRVKTLHPRIHAGLLAKHNDLKHRAQLEENDILPIEVAVVNLYPFIQNLSGDKAASPAKMVELIDIGGPTMIRAAAKNFASVYAVLDPSDYEEVGRVLKTAQHESFEARSLRLRLSQKVFTAIAHYNLEIAKYLSVVQANSEDGLELNPLEQLDLAPVMGVVLERKQALRYGENPIQRAAFYQQRASAKSSWQQLNGKDLSYNNLLDFDAALRLIRCLDRKKACAVIIKHLNPCGAAYGEKLLVALQRAKKSDPRSHFGGVIAFNTTVTPDVAQDIRGDFAEIVIAPSYDPAALEVLRSNKNLRVIQVELEEDTSSKQIELRLVEGGALLQERDPGVSKVSAAKVVSARQPTQQELHDLQFAWELCAHVKSNAISIVKQGLLLGVGAGQMSRIDSAELAITKAKRHGHDLQGAVVASDAFFPFPDSIETLAQNGVSAIIAPCGAKRDPESVEAANRLGISLLFVEDRHFRH